MKQEPSKEPWTQGPGEAWTYKKAFNEALKEMQDRALGEFKKLKASAKQADKIMKKMQAKEKKDD